MNRTFPRYQPIICLEYPRSDKFGPIWKSDTLGKYVNDNLTFLGKTKVDNKSLTANCERSLMVKRRIQTVYGVTKGDDKKGVPTVIENPTGVEKR